MQEQNQCPYPGNHNNMMQIIQSQYSNSLPLYDNNMGFQGLYSPSEKVVQQAVDNAYKRSVESVYVAEEYNQQLQMKAAEAGIRIREKVIVKEVDEESAERKQKRAADIRSKTKLQGKKVDLLGDGTVQYVKETFGDPAKRTIPFKIGEKIIFRCEGMSEKILAVGYRVSNRAGGIYLWTDRLRAKELTLKFNEAGLYGGYSQKEEVDFRMALVQTCLASAREKYLPEKLGWNLLNDEMRFIFPEFLTWREVAGYAGKRN